MTQSDYSTAHNMVLEKPACFHTSTTEGLTTLLTTPDSEYKIAEGGLRLQGLYKLSREGKPLITVVTVVYNCAAFLESTIKSVIEQTYDNVEYIIVDGGSTDGTLDVIKQYEEAIDYWVSEPDKGICDAMNKGIDLGSGDWINFMNADDWFFERETLHQVFSKGQALKNNDVIYGDCQVRYLNKTKLVKAGDLKNLSKGNQFCHQSVFIRLKFHKKNKYNLCRRIAADFEFFYKSYQSGANMIAFPMIISEVSAGGISDVERIQSILERWSVVDKTNSVNISYVILIISTLFKSVIKSILKRRYL